MREGNLIKESSLQEHVTFTLLGDSRSGTAA
jgi:hypothetical protein